MADMAALLTQGGGDMGWDILHLGKEGRHLCPFPTPVHCAIVGNTPQFFLTDLTIC